MKLSPKAKAALDQVINQFKTGDLSALVHVARIRRAPGDHPRPFDNWSFSNQIIAYAQTGSTDLRGYRQWQAAGRQVKKGSKATFILAPCTKKIDNDRTGEKETALIGFKGVAVFPLDATEGNPLPEYDYTPAQLPPLSDVARRLGVKTTWQPLPPDRLGDCNGPGDKINVGTYDPHVFFHEIAHAAHARVDGGYRQGSKAHKETIADFTACVLMQLYGLGDRTGNTWRYIQHYSKSPLTAITKALKKVEQVLAVLLPMQMEPQSQS